MKKLRSRESKSPACHSHALHRIATLVFLHVKPFLYLSNPVHIQRVTKQCHLKDHFLRLGKIRVIRHSSASGWKDRSQPQVLHAPSAGETRRPARRRLHSRRTLPQTPNLSKHSGGTQNSSWGWNGGTELCTKCYMTRSRSLPKYLSPDWRAYFWAPRFFH